MTTWPGTSIPKSTGNAFDWRAGMRPPVETRVCIKCGEEKPVCDVIDEAVERILSVMQADSIAEFSEAVNKHARCTAKAR